MVTMVPVATNQEAKHGCAIGEPVSAGGTAVVRDSTFSWLRVRHQDSSGPDIIPEMMIFLGWFLEVLGWVP